MSGLTVRNKDLSLLDEMVKLDSSAMKLSKDGRRIESDTSMVFKSGLNRVMKWGGDKSSADKATNERTLKALMGYIQKQTGEDVHDKVMNTRIKLDGDKTNDGYTMRERIERGTYVSSDLVKQLRYVTRQALDAQDPEREREIRRFQAYQPQNLRKMDEFFGREKRDNYEGFLDKTAEQIVDGAKGILSEITTRITGDKPETGFRKAIREIARDQSVGGEEANNSNVNAWKGQTRTWKTFEDYFLKGGGDPGDKSRDVILKKLEMFVATRCDTLARDGRSITDADMKQAVKDFLATPGNMARFVDETNQQIVNRLTPQELADAIEKWPEANGLKDDKGMQNAAEWLAAAIRKVDPDGGDGVPQMLRHLPRDGGLLDKFKGLFSQYDARKDPDNICAELMDTIFDNAKNVIPPSNLGNRERLAWLRDHFPQGLDAALKYAHPKEFDSLDVARLIGSSIKDLLVEHKENMEWAMEEDLKFRSDRHKQLLDNVSFRALPNLRSMINTTSADSYDRMGMPRTASEFVKGTVMRQISQMETERKIAELKREHGPDVMDDPSMQEKVANHVAMTVETHEYMIFDDILPSIDEYAAFEKDVEDIKSSPGGFAGASRETLDRLDAKSSELLQRGEEVEGLGDLLLRKYNRDEYGDPVRSTGLALGMTAYAMQSVATNYRALSGSVEREIENLQKDVEDLKSSVAETIEAMERQIEEEAARRAEEIRKAKEPDPSLAWAKDSLKEQFKFFPEMEKLATKAANPALLASYGSISGLIQGIVLGGHKIDIQSQYTVEELMTDLAGVIDRQRDADQEWDEHLSAPLQAFDHFVVLQKRIEQLGGIDNLENASPLQLADLRAAMLNIDKEVGDLSLAGNHINQVYSGADIIPMDDVMKAMFASTAYIFEENVKLGKVLTEIENAPPPPLPLTWEKPSFEERLSHYPTMEKLTDRIGFSRDFPGSIRGMVHKLVVAPETTRVNDKYADDRNALARRREKLNDEWGPIGQRLDALDSFAEIRATRDRLGVDGLSRLSPSDREAMRRRTQETMDTVSTLNTSLQKMQDVLSNAPTVGFTVKDVTDALDGTRRAIMSEGKDLLATLAQIDRKLS